MSNHESHPHKRRYTPFVRHAGELPFWLNRQLGELHGDQRGTISVVTVVAMLVFTMILGMLINVGRQVDDKIKLQNAADSATYSGGVILARGMNAIAFTNHLLCEVFALTAYMREGRDRSSEQMIPEILAAWQEAGQKLSTSGFAKFDALGAAVVEKVPLEQELVTAFGEMTAVKSEVTLPALEYILGEPGPSGAPESHWIPEFQRAVVRTIPLAAQGTMEEIAQRMGPAESSGNRTRPLSGVLWRTRLLPVGYPDESDPLQRTLPAVDPSPTGPDAAYLGGQYLQESVGQRRALARHYLEAWIADDEFDLGPFEREAISQGGKVSGKMSQFINLWRIFTCGQLNRLLDEEYPTTNIPHMIRDNTASALDADHMFVGVVYWPQKIQFFPGMYSAQIQGDALAFSQVFLFIPKARYRRDGDCPNWAFPVYDQSGAIVDWNNCYDNWPSQWDLFNQNWTVKPVPSTTDAIAEVLQTSPTGVVNGVTLPNFGGMNSSQVRSINTH